MHAPEVLRISFDQNGSKNGTKIKKLPPYRFEFFIERHFLVWCKGYDVKIHVDAASGGFVAPFVEPELRWDFRLKNVISINTSGHK